MSKLRLLASSGLLVFTLVFGVSIAFGQITPSADAYTNSAAPTTNYGANVLLAVDGATEAAYIQFNLASIPTTYTSADITKATLKLYVNTVPTAGSFNVDYVNGTWAENTISHNLAPALGTTIGASVPITTADKNQFILIDVTAAVQAWLSGTPNDGIALVANGTFNATFDSKENGSTSHAPELDIVFAGIAGVTTASGSGLTGGGTSGTLNVGLLNTCATGQVLEWTGTAWACTSPKGTGTVTKVATGAGLTGGPITGSGTLSIATGGVTNAMLADSYAQLGAANTFTGNETVSGTLNATSSGITIVGTTIGATGIGLQGIATAPTGGTFAVIGTNSSTSGIGVAGFSQPQTGNTVGVQGVSNSPTGTGVYGLNNAGTGNAVGVFGTSSSATGYGVEGTSPNFVGVYGTGGEFGVLGLTNSTTALGVAGVFGQTSSTNNAAGIQGNANALTGNSQGVYGEAFSPSGFGVLGVNESAGSPTISTNGAPYGVAGASSFVGVYGASGASGFIPPASGVWGDAEGTSTGTNFGIFGSAGDGTAGGFINDSQISETINAYNATGSSGGAVFVGEMSYVENRASVLAIIGDPGCGAGDNRMAIQLSQGGMSNCNNYTLTAGNNGETYLNANASETVHLRVNNTDALVASGTGVNVVGTLSKGGGSFKIDHPLDPANKYLYHSFVESPDMKNIYDGTVTTDGAGMATVTLPDWFESLNRDFRYQLTVIGQFAQAIVAGKVANNQFRIQTDKPNVEVSWQVTGIRQDAFANANRIPVEVEKAAADRGHYLYPEAIGQPTSARIGYEAPPPASEHIAHQRPTLARRSNASSTVFGAPVNRPAPPMPAMQKRGLPWPIEPQPTTPRVAPLPHPAGLAGKPDVNQK